MTASLCMRPPDSGELVLPRGLDWVAAQVNAHACRINRNDARKAVGISM